MSSISMSSFLRRVLLADAVVSAGPAAAMLLGASALSGLLGLPAVLLTVAGTLLVPYVALVFWMARRPQVPRVLLWFVVVCNVGWAIDCLLIAFGGLFAPNAWGQAFLAVQVAAVLLFAELQVVALRRDRRPVAV